MTSETISPFPVSASSRVWLITGASSGIGRHVAELLLAQGDRVAAVARHIEKLDDLSDRFPETLWRHPLDVTDTAAMRHVVDQAFSHMGRIDILLSNAGYALIGAAEELSDESIGQQLATNLMAPIQLIRACLPRFRQQRGGHILQVSSEGGQIAYPSASLYHASKWGVEGFCEALAMEVAPFGIKMTIVQPGRTKTGFDDNAVLSANPIEAYRRSTVGNYLRLIEMGRFPCIGDARKVASAIIEVSTLERPPIRLTLGSDSYENIRRALTKRLLELDTQKEISKSTDSG